jgi:hypothetical protein
MLKAFTIAATVAAVTLAIPTQQAEARDGAIAAGVIGGLAAGAIIGSAASQQPRNYYAGPGYAEPAYAPVYGRCYMTREYDGYRYRRVRVCD